MAQSCYLNDNDNTIMIMMMQYLKDNDDTIS